MAQEPARTAELTAIEMMLLQQSADFGSTRKRARASLLLGAALIGGLAWLAFGLGSIGWLFGVAAGYVALAVFQKVAQAALILHYKSLVQKLARGLAEAPRD